MTNWYFVLHKCNFVTIGDQFASQFSISNFKFTVANENITKSDTVKDLGVYVDHKLDFKKHINDLVVRSKQRSALIFCSFIFRDTWICLFVNEHACRMTILFTIHRYAHITRPRPTPLSISHAYISYIRPLLEYASPIWSPSLHYLNDSIESVQRAYTKRLPGLQKLFLRRTLN